MRTGFRLSGLLLACLMVGVLLLTSCSTTPASPEASPAAGASPNKTAPVPTTAGQPKPTATASGPTGSLVVTESFGGGHIDPLIGTGRQHDTLGGAIWDSLLSVTADDQVAPGVAERWEISPDGLVHTFYIRKGIKFHDGSDLTAVDVKFSVERMLNSTTQSFVSIWKAAVASVEMKDTYTVAIRMKSPQYERIKDIDGPMGAVMPKKYFEEKGAEYFQAHPIGSGPWKFVSYTPDAELKLVAVDSHWRAVPKFKNLTILNVKEESTKIAMLKTGELDIAMISSDSVAALKSAGLRILNYDGGGRWWGQVFFPWEQANQFPVGDVKVRKAMQLSINAKEMANAFYGGAGGPYSLQGVPLATALQLKPDPYDPEGAKKLLAEAGYPKGFRHRLSDTGGGGVQSLINAAVAGYYRAVGIDAYIVAMEHSAHRSLYAAPKLDPSISNSTYIYVISTADTVEISPTFYHSTKGIFHNINDPALDKIIDKIPATADPVEKKRLMLEGATLARNNYTTLSILAFENIVAIGPKVGDLAPAFERSLLATQYETVTHGK
ncbi:MAG: ABC transporter substrate-binding protein [Dehalococcoidia bacterium]|nr:ABC transporter substrate-binding protein [Dehalococcoidia bacterium]